MPGAHKRRQLRAVKVKSNIKDEIFAAKDPHILSDAKPAAKVEPTDLAKKEPDLISEHINGRDKLESAHVARDLKKETLHFFVTLAAYLLGFGTLSLGILFLWDPSIIQQYGVATKLVALVIGRLYMGTGLAMLILVYQKHLRSLGTLLLCEAMAEIVMMVLASNSGSKIDFLVGFPMTGVKGALGLWMVNSGE